MAKFLIASSFSSISFLTLGDGHCKSSKISSSVTLVGNVTVEKVREVDVAMSDCVEWVEERVLVVRTDDVEVVTADGRRIEIFFLLRSLFWQDNGFSI